MFNKKYLFFLTFFVSSFISGTESNISNYKKYKDTTTQFRLEQLNVTLEHPWALSFIKDNELIVTEKGGGLFTYNLDDGSKTAIKHKIPHIAYKPGVRKGVCLMCTITLWMTISILPTAMMSMETIPVQPLLRESWWMMRL